MNKKVFTLILKSESLQSGLNLSIEMTKIRRNATEEEILILQNQNQNEQNFYDCIKKEHKYIFMHYEKNENFLKRKITLRKKIKRLEENQTLIIVAEYPERFLRRKFQVWNP